MDWGYLGEFWNAIASTTISAWEYSTSWFQNIGNAVAGAVGGAFDWILHYVNDFFVFLGWVLTGVKTLFYIFTAPMNYFFTFIKSFWGTAIKDPITISSELSIYSTSTNEILGAIPYWDTLTYILGVGLLVLGAVGIIYLFLRI